MTSSGGPAEPRHAGDLPAGCQGLGVPVPQADLALGSGWAEWGGGGLGGEMRPLVVGRSHHACGGQNRVGPLFGVC